MPKNSVKTGYYVNCGFDWTAGKTTRNRRELKINKYFHNILFPPKKLFGNIGQTKDETTKFSSNPAKKTKNNYNLQTMSRQMANSLNITKLIQQVQTMNVKFILEQFITHQAYYDHIHIFRFSQLDDSFVK